MRSQQKKKSASPEAGPLPRLPYRGALRPGNLYKNHGLFVCIPSWWQTFLFRVLKPNELAVYLHICSVIELNASFPVSLGTIAHDLGLSGRNDVINAIKALEDLGFIIREVGYVSGKLGALPQSVFQRPSIPYTIARLLDQDIIDASLRPTAKGVKRVRASRKVKTEADQLIFAARNGLEKLLSEDFVEALERSPKNAKAQKRRKLITALQAVVAELEAPPKPKRRRKASDDK